MSTQLERENDLICSDVLGWTRYQLADGSGWSDWRDHCGRWVERTRTPYLFADWTDAGLIMDALKARMKVECRLESHGFDGKWKCVLTGSRSLPFVVEYGDTAAVAIRWATVHYLEDLDKEMRQAIHDADEEAFHARLP